MRGRNRVDHLQQMLLTPRSARLRGAVRNVLLSAEGLVAPLPFLSKLDARYEARRLVQQWRRERARSAHPLSASERSRSSQNGEDGVLDALFTRIGTKNRVLVEIGAGEGTENCTRALIDQGWSGLWIEADPIRAERCRLLSREGLQVLTATVRRDNVVSLLESANIPTEPDLVVMDIDGNDWWVLEKLLMRFRPRVLVAEYNSCFSSNEWWVRRYRPNAMWDGTFRHGASLLALADLGKRHGLGVVYCEQKGVNAFLVAGTEIERVQDLSVGNVADTYVGPWYTHELWGHARRPEAATPMLATTPAERAGIEIKSFICFPAQHTLEPGEPVGWAATIANRSGLALRSSSPVPIHVAVDWDRGEGARESTRFRLPATIKPFARGVVAGWLPAPTMPGSHRLRAQIVQEGVAWFGSDAVEGPALHVSRAPVG